MLTSAPGKHASLVSRHRRAGNGARGFTLIEVAVVMLLIAILLGMTGVRLMRDRSDIVRDEASRLVIALQNAQQQAVLEGRPYALELTQDGYRFLYYVIDGNKGKWQPAPAIDLMAPHALPRPLAINATSADKKSDTQNNLVLFDPSGDLAAFSFAIRFDDVVWYVSGQNDGRIRASTILEPTTT